MTIRTLLLVCGLILLSLATPPAPTAQADVDIKPGDVIGPDNWQRVQGMAGENLLRRIKQGYTLRIKEAKSRRPPKEFIEATERYSGKVGLSSNGEVLNYVAGLPFPHLNPNDGQAGTKVAWNMYWRWVGDDFKNGGGLNGGKIIQDAIEKNGAERRSNITHYFIKPRGRVTLDIKPTLPGYDHIDWMQIRATEYPRDSSGITTLEIRYAAAGQEDDFFIYVPSIRRVRRAPPIQRCATIAPGEFNYDDIGSFNGKITNFNYRLLGETKVLGNASQDELPFRKKSGDYLPLSEKWEVKDSYILEITAKNADYCYAKKVLYIDKVNWDPLLTMIWDKQGYYWKEIIASRVPVTLADGQEVSSTGTVVIVNVQNGRATVTTAVRAYNQGYQPSLFTLATLQTVMRGGTIR